MESNPTPAKPDVSIVVITFNRAHMLQRALKNLAALEPDDQWSCEIVVVNNASTDSTNEVIAEAAKTSPIPIRGVEEMRPGVSHARNKGVAESRGDWIAFVDDDELPEPDWMRKMAGFAREREIPIVGGVVRVVYDEPGYPVAAAAYQELLGRQAPFTVPLPVSPTRLPGTDNVLVHRRVFEKVGQFNPALSDGEDHDLFMRALDAGFTGWFTPEAVVDHLTPGYRMTEAYIRWRYLRYGKNRAQFDKKHTSFPKWCIILVARAGQALLQHLPRYIGARLLGKDDLRLTTRCLLWRFEGYLYTWLHLTAPSLFPQSKFFKYVEFRSERELFSTPS